MGSTYCYFHPLQLPPEQSSIRAKPNDVDFKRIKNRVVGCIWTPASLQEELLAEMFTVKPHTPLFQEQKFVNQERLFSNFARVYSHTVLARMTGWRQRTPWGWDDTLVCGERDDTDLDKGKRKICSDHSVTLLRDTVYEQNGNLAVEAVSLRWKEWQIAHSFPKAALHQARVQEPVNRRFMPIFTNHRKKFPQLWHGESSYSVTDWQGEWWQCSEHKEPESVTSWRAGEQGRTCIC